MTHFNSFARDNALKTLPINFLDKNLYFLENTSKKLENIDFILNNEFIVIDVNSTGLNAYSEDLPTKIVAKKINSNTKNDKLVIEFNFEKLEDGTIIGSDAKEDILSGMKELITFSDNGKIPFIVHYSDYPISLLKNLTVLISDMDISGELTFYDVTQLFKIPLSILNKNILGMSLKFLCNKILGKNELVVSGAEGGVNAIVELINKIIEINATYKNELDISKLNGQKQADSLSFILKERNNIASNTKIYVQLLSDLYTDYDVKQTKYEELFKKYYNTLLKLTDEEIDKILKETGYIVMKNGDTKVANHYASYNGKTAVLFLNGKRVEIRQILGEENINTDTNSVNDIDIINISELFNAYEEMMVVRTRLSQLISFFKQIYGITKYARYGGSDLLLTIQELPVKRILSRIPDFNVLDNLEEINDEVLFTTIKGGISFGKQI